MAIDRSILPLLPAPLANSLTSTHLLQNLWSNYGSLYRLHLSSKPSTLVLKHVSPPPLSPGSHPSESHLRKLISYRVERYFYLSLIPSASLPAHTKIATPYPNPTDDTTLLLEDLSPSFPSPAYGYCTQAQAGVVLKWLAGLHGTFLGRTDKIPAISPPLEVASPDTATGIWENGGYWYRATRQDEYDSMISDRQSKWLIPWVDRVAGYLSDPKRPGRTLVHGDAKAANIMFSKDGKEAAMYDFQYVGKGLGVVDLVYFLGTSVERGVMRNQTTVDKLLGAYWEELERCADKKELEKMGGLEGLKSDLNVAIVDWWRFMAGWGEWGNGWVSDSKAREIVEKWERDGFPA